MNLNKFSNAQQNILIAINNVEIILKKYRVQSASTKLHQVYETLKDENFRVMVVGEFSNGKSTFLNALMRHKILPAHNEETTSVINRISYNAKENYTLIYHNGKEKEVGREEFLNIRAPKTIESENKTLLAKMNIFSKELKYIDVSYPSPLLKNGVVLVDSPGKNGLDKMREEITNQYIPNSEAVIFLFSAKQTFTASEKQFLKRILQDDIRKLFFVINKIDQVKSVEERKLLFDVTSKNLQEIVPNPKVHMVTARHALQNHLIEAGEVLNARVTRTLLPLEETGMPGLEKHLMRFLTAERGNAKLEKAVYSTHRIIDSMIQKTINTQIFGLQNDKQDVQKQVQMIQHRAKEAEVKLKDFNKTTKVSLKNDFAKIGATYSKDLKEIETVAMQTYHEQKDKLNREQLKEAIDEAVLANELKMNEMLKKQIEKAIIKALKDENKQLFSLLEDLENTLVVDQPDWDIQVTNKNSGLSNGKAIAVGAAGGLAASVAGAGFLGTALVIGVFGFLANLFTSERNYEEIDNFEENLKARYSHTIKTRVTSLEKSLQSLEKKVIIDVEKNVEISIDDARKQADELLHNTNLKDSEIEEKKLSLQKDKEILIHLKTSMNNVLTQYQRESKV